jgi:SAM-dependent methyltransferase
LRIAPEDLGRFKQIYVDPRGVNDEKYLEYYAAFTMFQFSPGDVYIDIAAQDCPFHRFVAHRFGVKAYRQDLHYLNGSADPYDVACDACSLPFPDGSFTHMSLFNSFEHFEDDRDTAFMREAQRVLRPDGVLLIVPLQISTEYSIKTDEGYYDEAGVKHLWGVGARFSRTYDLKRFRDRVVRAATGLEFYVYRIEEPWAIGSGCYAEWFVMFKKKTRQKNSWVSSGSGSLPSE